MYCQSMSGACRSTSAKHRATRDSCGTVLASRQLAIRCFVDCHRRDGVGSCCCSSKNWSLRTPTSASGCGGAILCQWPAVVADHLSCSVSIFLFPLLCLCCWLSPPTLQPGTIHFLFFYILFFSFFVSTYCSDKFLSHFTSGS